MARSSDEDYIKTMKMAIALACIRNKPEGITAAEYADQLCRNYLKKQQTCQEKLKSAENEILKLKQQLVMQSALETNILVHSLNSVEYENPCLTPPSSGVHTETTQQPCESNSLIQHTAFLQSILNLQAVNRTPQLTSVTYITIKNSLTMLKYCIENNKDILMPSIQKNVFVIMTLLDSERIVDLVQVVDSVLEIVTCLLTILLDKEHRSAEQAECMVTLVTSFCHVKLFEKIIKILLTVIEEFSNHLRHVNQRKETINILKYWNSCYIFRIFENIIFKHRSHSLLASSDFVAKVNDRLDQTMLHLTDPFPVFAHAIWKLQGILNQFSTCNKI